MARVRVTLRNQKGQMAKDGTYNVKISVSHKEKTRFIWTQYSVLPSQLDGGQVIDHQDAYDYNIELRNILNVYDKKIRDLGGRVDYMDVSSLVEILRDVNTEGRDSDFFFFYQKVLDELKGDDHVANRLALEYTLITVKSFHSSVFLAFQEITPEWLERFERNQERLGNSVNSRIPLP